MPTGYTAPVVDGKIYKLEDFALTCARAFGALVNYRDNSLSKTVTVDELNDSFDIERYAQKVKDARTELDAFNRKNEGERKAVYNTRKAQAERRYIEAREKNAIVRDRLENLLDQVNDWLVPDELDGLKRFMREQLEKTIEYDGRVPESRYYLLPDYEEWKATELRLLKRNIEYAKERYDKAIERRDEAVRWYELLLESL